MRILLAVTAAFAAAAFSVPADASRPQDREQDQAWRATQRGQILPLRTIESIIIPRMQGADYLGPEFDGDRYRLKFMRMGRVMWIDIDARSGRIIGKSGF